MKYIGIAFMLLALPCMAATPVSRYDPTNCFVGYPWSTNAPTLWNNVDATNHIVKQLMLSLKDRCDVAGHQSLGNFEKDYVVWAGSTTNYSYTDKGYLVVSNVVTTNIITRTNFPYITLQMTNRLWNTYGKFDYDYPSNVMVNGSGVNTTTGQIYATNPMWQFLNNGIEQICANYANITNIAISNSFVVLRPYNMVTLLWASGYTNGLSNFVYEAGELVGGDWHWQTELPSNNVVTLAALDERAACIAQMRYVYYDGKSCNPMFFNTFKSISLAGGEEVGFSHDDPETNTLQSSRTSYAWRQESTGAGGTTNFTVTHDGNPSDGSWADIYQPMYPFNYIWNDYEIVFTSGRLTDWPVSGWYVSLDCHVAFWINRSGTNPVAWRIATKGGPFNWDTTLNAETNYVADAYSVRVGGSTPFVWTVDASSGASNATWISEETTRSNLTDYSTLTPSTNLIPDVYDETKVCTNLEYTTIDSNRFITFGRYTTQNLVEVRVVFTNSESIPPRTVPTNKFINCSTTNVTDLILVNKVVTNWFSQWTTYTSYGYWTNGDTAVGITNSGSYWIDAIFADSSKQWKTEVWTIKPDICRLYTNKTATISLWFKGGQLHDKGYWGEDGMIGNLNTIWEWEEGEPTATNGYDWIHPPIPTFYINCYTNVISYTIPTDCTTNAMIFYTNLYGSAKSRELDGDHPFDGQIQSRAFWGISNAVWLMDAGAFTNCF